MHKRLLAGLIAMTLCCAVARSQDVDEDDAPVTSQGESAVTGGAPEIGGAPAAGLGFSDDAVSASSAALKAAARGAPAAVFEALEPVAPNAGARFVCRPGPPPKTESDDPRILDMVLTGAGRSRSAVARSVLLAGRYPYVSGEPGLQTIDVSDPAALRVTADWPHSSRKMNGAAVKGRVLYVANWSPEIGLLVFDLVNPAVPALLKTIATPLHAWDARVHGDLLDVSVGNETKSAIVTYDIKDPRNPAHLHTLEIDDRLIGNTSRYRGHLYVTHKEYLYVYESKDSANPKRLRELSFGGLCGQTQVRGDHLYMINGGVRVFSLKDPANPKQVAFWASDEPRGMHFQEDMLIVPASGSGIYTLDVSNPASPELLAHWYPSWPGMGHGGYPVTVAGSGDHVFVGTTGGEQPRLRGRAVRVLWGTGVQRRGVAAQRLRSGRRQRRRALLIADDNH